jgi:hypothetical protein
VLASEPGNILAKIWLGKITAQSALEVGLIRLTKPMWRRFRRKGDPKAKNWELPHEKGLISLKKSGAGDEIRTRDLNLGKVALYH